MSNLVLSSKMLLYCNMNTFILFICTLILIIISYKLYKNDFNNESDNEYKNYIENFSVLKKLKSKNNFENTISNKLKKNKFKNVKNKFKNINNETTLDDLMRQSEAFSKKKEKVDSFTDSLEKYKNSFNNKKFKNNSKNTAESFEKFDLYKKKLFELFK